ncbi:MAG TPA: cupin domain-containing protein, partial [Alteromonas australica]|nr:cupin domain-containing protein [Alteromonas australica]
WDGHGVKNTGEEDLVFVVFKWQSKGVPVMNKPEGEKAN